MSQSETWAFPRAPITATSSARTHPRWFPGKETCSFQIGTRWNDLKCLELKLLIAIQLIYPLLHDRNTNCRPKEIMFWVKARWPKYLPCQAGKRPLLKPETRQWVLICEDLNLPRHLYQYGPVCDRRTPRSAGTTAHGCVRENPNWGVFILTTSLRPNRTAISHRWATPQSPLPLPVRTYRRFKNNNLNSPLKGLGCTHNM